MKMKLFLFSTFFLGSMGLSFLWSDSVHATGESYRWVNETTIEGSGGSYLTNIRDNDGTSASPVTFTRDGTTGVYKASDLSVTVGSNGPRGISTSCDLQLAIVIGSDVGAGAVRPNDSGAEQCDTNLDTNVTIANQGAAPDPSGFSGTQDEATEEALSMCGVDGIGWIICPLSTSIAEGVDAIFGLIKELLVFKSYTTDRTSGLYPAWSIMRNFANIAFVLAFMVIIYSQLTSMGLNNYGIKKMLPRLIIAAILVNVSYWLCGIAVDISNILGASLNSLMIDLAGRVSGDGVDVNWVNATATILSGTAVAGVAAYTSIAALGSFSAVLWALVPLLISAIFAVLVALLILAARQVLLIIFIVISPLAFVAYLLPNTNKWFQKWQSAFITLLLMYPIIAIIFGGSQFASAIILSADNLTMIMVLLGLAVQAIPLAMTPMLMKLSSGLLGQFAGIVNNPKRGPLDSVKNAAKERQDLATKRGLAASNPNPFNAMGQRRDNSRRKRELKGKTYDATTNSRWEENVAQDSELKSLNNELTAQTSRGSEAQKVQKKTYLNSLGKSTDETPSELLKTAAGLGGEDAQAKIMAAVKAEEVNEITKAIENVKITAEFPPGGKGIEAMGERLEAAVKSGNTVESRAMQDMLLSSGQAGIEQWRASVARLGKQDGFDVEDGTMKNALTTETMTEMRRDLLTKHGALKASAIDVNTFGVKGGTTTDIKDEAGNVVDTRFETLEAIQTNTGTYKMSDEELVHQKPSTINLALDNHAVSPAQASRIIGNEELAKFLNDDDLRARIQGVASAAPPAPPSAPPAPGTLEVPHTPPETPPRA